MQKILDGQASRNKLDGQASSLSNYIMYLDANNLYGWAMSCMLPEKDFQWQEGLTEQDIVNYVEGDTGYFVECDLEYPQELHDKHNDYPLAPVKTCVKADMLSPHTKELYRKVYDLKSNQKIPDEHVEKLLLTLQDKEKYVVHIRMLQWYLKQGLKLKKIHRVISFKQSAWLEPYIKFNTEKRKQAKTDFEKDFFKLMNNAPYGKTMEDVQNHMDFELVTDIKRYDKLVNEPTYKHTSIINESIVGVERAYICTGSTMTCSKPSMGMMWACYTQILTAS